MPYFAALIADDHGLYRTGLAFLLKDSLGIAEVLEAADFDSALDSLASGREIKLALFDLGMPGMAGPETLSVVRDTYPELRVAVISGSEDRDLVLRTVGLGLSGYVPKSLPEDEIAKAMQMILDGHVYVPRFMAAGMPKTAAPPLRQAAPEASSTTATKIDVEALTPRQRDVLGGILRGRSNKEIARDLDIAEGTVKIHLAALFVHFGVRNRTELATRAQGALR